MAYSDLQDFIRKLEKEGELKRISAEVDPELEITEINDRVVKQGGPALLFENVRGARFPVAINLYGSEKRMAMALGLKSVEEAADRIRNLLEMEPPSSFTEKVKSLPMLMELAQIAPKTVRSGICQEVVETENPSFDPFPILKCWPDDGGRYITLPMVITRDANTGKRNVGMYRVQIYDSKTAGMHWQTQKDAAAHYQDAAWEHRPKIPVAICFGGDPAMTYSGSAPLPPGLDEFLLAGFLRRRPVEMVKAKTIDLEVPASAEIVFEGYVVPGEQRPEGPFGDHTGFYTPVEPFPVFHLTAVTHRKNPVYPTTVVGKPPMEDLYLGWATERLFMPVIRKTVPEVVDMHMPAEGIFNNLVIVSIKKRWPGHARKVMNAFWGLGQLMFTKVIVVVDHDVDVRNVREVAWKTGTNIDPKRDICIMEGPVDTLNHASPLRDYGSKMGIDATTKWPEEGYAREWPDEIFMSDEVVEKVTRRWKEYGF